MQQFPKIETRGPSLKEQDICIQKTKTKEYQKASNKKGSGKLWLSSFQVTDCMLSFKNATEVG